ncbi:MAG: hypothetical protein ABIA93_02630 [Candidatus Woesearchaeota archaeon]
MHETPYDSLYEVIVAAKDRHLPELRDALADEDPVRRNERLQTQWMYVTNTLDIYATFLQNGPELPDTARIRISCLHESLRGISTELGERRDNIEGLLAIAEGAANDAVFMVEPLAGKK